MKISFVIPAYNEQDYLGLCLDSVLRELSRGTYDAEIIVVNNASTDNTPAVAASFPGVTVVTETKKGLTAARAAGFRAATGELIANIDADTMLPPGWLATVMAEFSKRPNLVALSGPMAYYDVPFMTNLARWTFYGLAYVSYVVNKCILKIGSLVQGGNFVVRRSALQQIGGYDTAFEFYGEDADMARRLHKVGDVRFTFRLPMNSSGRRLIVEGAWTTAYHYAANYFSTLILKKPITTTARAVRSADVESIADTQSPLRKTGLFVALGAVTLAVIGAGVLVGNQNIAKSNGAVARVQLAMPATTVKLARLEDRISTKLQEWYSYIKDTEVYETITN